MNDHQFSWIEKCKSCNGTGIYVGFAEQDGAGIQCKTCKGTGKCERTIVWDEFTSLVPREDIKRVFRSNPGITIGENPDLQLEDFGGISYEDWFAGKPFPPKSEMRKFSCPAGYYQSVNCDLKPKWDECNFCGWFYDCKHFKDKEKCWERWDKEFGEK